MRLSNIEIPNDDEVGAPTHHAFICVTHGGFTRHSAEYCASAGSDPKVVKNVALKFRLPSPSVPTNWSSPGIINVASPGGRGKMVDRIGLRVLNKTLVPYVAHADEIEEWSFTLTLVCEDSAL